MKYHRIVVTKHGGPEMLQPVEEDAPEPRAGAVRITPNMMKYPFQHVDWYRETLAELDLGVAGSITPVIADRIPLLEAHPPMNCSNGADMPARSSCPGSDLSVRMPFRKGSTAKEVKAIT